MRPLAVLSLLALALTGCAVGVRLPATGVTGDGATLNGKVLSTSGGPGSWFFEYGLLPDPQVADRTPARAIDFVLNESHPVSEPVAGLDPGRAYHHRVCAEDGENPGDPFCSPYTSFRTAGDAVHGTVVTDVVGDLEQSYEFEVGSGPSGQDVSGHVLWHLVDGQTIIGTPLCLAVVGNRALIGIDWAGADPGYVAVEDGDPDRTGSVASETPDACSTFSEDVPLSDVISGDVAVDDAELPPT